MVAFSKTAIAAAVALGMVQYCPAPFAAIPIIVSIDLGSAAAWVTAAGVVAGSGASAASAIEASKGKKREVPNTLPRDIAGARQKRQAYGTQLAWEECHSDLGSATVGFSSAGVGSILVTGIPATCMTLATTITGQFDAGDPVPMSSSSIQFNNVDTDTINQIQAALEAK